MKNSSLINWFYLSLLVIFWGSTFALTAIGKARVASSGNKNLFKLKRYLRGIIVIILVKAISLFSYFI